MPTRSEVASYTLGVRLSQALAISTPGGRALKAELQAAIERLRQAFDNLARSFRDFDPFARRRGCNVLENCWSSANQISHDPDDVSDPESICCFDQLTVLRQIVTAALTDLSIGDWLQLGFEVPRGYWHDPDSHPRYIYEPSPQIRTKPCWMLDAPERVEELSKQLGVGWVQLFPEEKESESDPELFRGLPWGNAGWCTIEAGMRDLSATAVPDLWQQPAEPGPFLPSELQVRILKKLDRRSLTGEELAAELGITDKRKLYADKRRTTKGPLLELIEAGLIKKSGRLGYYRPDLPPPDALEAAE